MKKINLSVMAVLLGTALAFAGSKGISFPEAQDEQWFELTMGGDPGNPNDYTLSLEGEPEGCTAGSARCAILALEDANNPGKPTPEGVATPISQVFRTNR